MKQTIIAITAGAWVRIWFAIFGIKLPDSILVQLLFMAGLITLIALATLLIEHMERRA